jgi:AraC-like DNA-binding protein
MVSNSALVRRVVDLADPRRADEALRVSLGVRYTGRLLSDRDRFRFQLDGMGSDWFSIDRVSCTGSLATDQLVCQTVLIAHLRAGQARIATAHAEASVVPGNIVLGDPVRPHSATCDNVGAEVVRLDLATARRVLAGRAGIEPDEVSLELSVPLSPVRGRYWLGVVEQVRSEVLGNPDAAQQPLVRAQAFDQLCTALMWAFPNSAGTALTDGHRTVTPARPAALRRALTYIDEHAHEPIGITEIAEASGIGARGLQQLFRSHREDTPLGYLRAVRMRHAHHDLQAADPATGDTVAAIAARWGFTHPARFAADYRHRYGQHPSTTLRT